MPDTLTPYTPVVDPEAINRALMAGDLSKLSPADRTQYYLALCQSQRLNPLTRPLITLKTADGSLQWYVTVSACEQLRKRDRISMRVLSREQTADGMYCVTVQASTPDGRVEESQGIVTLAEPRMVWRKTAEGKNYQTEEKTASGDPILIPLQGKARENAMMRCESKAKRRATLAICGLGLPGEEEMSGAAVPFDPQTGELVEGQAEEPPALEVSPERAAANVGELFDRSTGDPQEDV